MCRKNYGADKVGNLHATYEVKQKNWLFCVLLMSLSYMLCLYRLCEEGRKTNNPMKRHIGSSS